ncbi:MAG: (5-formylfuran-3-yl)methyl phosphate synthase [Methanoculleaceae archaeon]
MELLVSPRSVDEARNALAADIIDVKRPAEGSLGANFPWVIRAVKEIAGNKPVSAAIGDFDHRPGSASLSAYGAASSGADYIKVGLMLNGIREAREVVDAVTRAVKDEFPSTKVVIAAYGDYQRLGTISPMDITDITADAGADVAMIDTGIKDGKSLLEFMTEEDLIRFVEQNRGHDLKTALAGSLRFEDIEVMHRIGPDIIGVRGMVCGGDRNGTIQPDLVQKALSLVR